MAYHLHHVCIVASDLYLGEFNEDAARSEAERAAARGAQQAALERLLECNREELDVAYAIECWFHGAPAAAAPAEYRCRLALKLRHLLRDDARAAARV